MQSMQISRVIDSPLPVGKRGPCVPSFDVALFYVDVQETRTVFNVVASSGRRSGGLARSHRPSANAPKPNVGTVDRAVPVPEREELGTCGRQARGAAWGSARSNECWQVDCAAQARGPARSGQGRQEEKPTIVWPPICWLLVGCWQERLDAIHS